MEHKTIGFADIHESVTLSTCSDLVNKVMIFYPMSLAMQSND